MNATCNYRLVPERVVLRRSVTAPVAPYYAYHVPGAQRCLVAVHGISRNAREQAYAFSSLAQAYGVNLVCPLFDDEFFPDYQRLGRLGIGQRADSALLNILDDFARCTGAHSDERAVRAFDLFGFSGGAQFAHRFALAYPEHVRRLALTAPGWFTLPDATRRFPHGLRKNPRLPGMRFNLDRFLNIRTLVMVGSRDTLRDPSLRRNAQLDATQGPHRVARARNWVAAINAAARPRASAPPARLLMLPNSRHDFDDALDDRMDRILFEFLYATEICNEDS